MSTVDQKKFETQNSLPEGARTEAEGRNLTVSNEHGTFTLRIPAAGLTMSDMVIDAVIVLLVLLIVMILLLFRRRISSSLRNSREQRAALAAAQQAQGYGHGGNPEAYFMSRSGGGHQAQGYSPAQPAYSEEGNYQQDQYPHRGRGMANRQLFLLTIWAQTVPGTIRPTRCPSMHRRKAWESPPCPCLTSR